MRANPPNGANISHSCFLSVAAKCSLEASSYLVEVLSNYMPYPRPLQPDSAHVVVRYLHNLLQAEHPGMERRGQLIHGHSTQPTDKVNWRQQRMGSPVRDIHIITTGGIYSSHKSKTHTYCISIQSGRASKNSRGEIEISQLLR